MQLTSHTHTHNLNLSSTAVPIDDETQHDKIKTRAATLNASGICIHSFSRNFAAISRKQHVFLHQFCLSLWAMYGLGTLDGEGLRGYLSLRVSLVRPDIFPPAATPTHDAVF